MLDRFNFVICVVRTSNALCALTLVSMISAASASNLEADFEKSLCHYTVNEEQSPYSTKLGYSSQELRLRFILLPIERLIPNSECWILDSLKPVQRSGMKQFSKVC